MLEPITGPNRGKSDDSGPTEARRTSRSPARTPRVTPVQGGPLLVEGPVEIVMPDGSVQLSERPTVALCMCRRSQRFPFCDTSHRPRVRPEGGRSVRADGGRAS
ncbi:CDGSH iron-sulfur domain-containing protein [Streptomyces sp. NPDC002889]|uniref:CDGSH iron-sulfur domain-containing protein n=1 Tax=Streptomyces sp. NPDC002889 TaxID=3364669 RepID=UPI0036BE4FA9